MPYSAEVSRSNPSCILFLIDQSGSMEDPFGGSGGRRKADSLADAINRLLQNLAIKCAKSEGVRDYFHVGVVGYAAGVGPALSGSLAGRDLAPISEIANQPARVEERLKKVEDGAGGLVEQSVKFPVWLDPVAKGGTPMVQALGYATQVLQGWIANHPDSFPPVVINITDGESTDGDPETAASGLRDLSTSDGGVLLFNLHLSSREGQPIEFPSEVGTLPDAFATTLYQMSSPLPDYMVQMAQGEGYAVSDESRGFVFNADLVSVIRFLDIGTRPANLR